LKTALLLTLGASLLLAPALSAGPLSANGRAHELGLGLRLGAPAGLTLKYWMDNEDALDLAVGAYGYYRGNYTSDINMHLDFQHHQFGVFGSPGSEVYNQLPIYYGVGAMLNGPDVLGLRLVGGLTWLFENNPFDLFFDLAPTLVITPGPGFGIDAGLGGRFYF